MRGYSAWHRRKKKSWIINVGQFPVQANTENRGYPMDKMVGIFTSLVSSIGLALFVVTIFITPFEPGPFSVTVFPLRSNVSAVVPLLSYFLVLFAIAHCLAGGAIRRGLRSGFILGIFIFGLDTVCLFPISSLGSLFMLILLTYGIARLSGEIGPPLSRVKLFDPDKTD